MTNFLTLSKVKAGPWIKHFEEQATKGGSKRFYTNRHYILVDTSVIAGDTNRSNKVSGDIGTVPPLVTPVQQSIVQAEEEVKREAQEENGGLSKDPKSVPLEPTGYNKRKLSCKGNNKSGKKKRFLVKDIFSK